MIFILLFTVQGADILKVTFLIGDLLPKKHLLMLKIISINTNMQKKEKNNIILIKYNYS